MGFAEWSDSLPPGLWQSTAGWLLRDWH